MISMRDTKISTIRNLSNGFMYENFKIWESDHFKF